MKWKKDQASTSKYNCGVDNNFALLDDVSIKSSISSPSLDGDQESNCSTTPNDVKESNTAAKLPYSTKQLDLSSPLNSSQNKKPVTHDSPDPSDSAMYQCGS